MYEASSHLTCRKQIGGGWKNGIKIDLYPCGKAATFFDPYRQVYLCGVHARASITSPARTGTLLPVPVELWQLAQARGVDIQVVRLGGTWDAELWQGKTHIVSAHYRTVPDKQFWTLVSDDLKEFGQ